MLVDKPTFNPEILKPGTPLEVKKKSINDTTAEKFAAIVLRTTPLSMEVVYYSRVEKGERKMSITIDSVIEKNVELSMMRAVTKGKVDTQ